MIRTAACARRGLGLLGIGLLGAVWAPAALHADGIAIVGGSPRAIGRAGTATVGDDGGGALLINPAAMARREVWRVELGTAEVDDTLRWQSDKQASALSSGRAGSRLAPIGAAIGGIGNWIVGAGIMTSGVSERSLPRPGGAVDLGSAYGYRYAGIAGGYRRDTVIAGVARRLGDSLAVGVSLGAARVHVVEQRRIWAGFGGRDVVGSPGSDVELRMSGTDQLAASAVAGVMYAPVDAQIELGASVAWARTVQLDGDAAAAGVPGGPAVTYPRPPCASLAVRQPVTMRAGGRYVGDRVVAELDGDLWLATAAARETSWQVAGIRVTDPSQAFYLDLGRLPSRISQHTHVALRTAVDVELMPGFLWATAGYAFSTAGTPAARLSPTFGDLGGHTLGLGIEGAAGGVTVTIGWSRTWSLATEAPSALALDNPFGVGDGAVPPGTYDGSLDQVGVLLEVELGHSRTP